jgi:type I restriction enzyme M protein
METRTLRTLDADDIAKIARTYHSWRNKNPEVAYEDAPGFCKAARLEEVRSNDFVLTPGRYVGAADVEDDGEPIEEKIARMKAELFSAFDEGRRLEALIRQSMDGLSHE